jgi:hypothetical protein
MPAPIPNMQKRMELLWLNEAKDDPIPWSSAAHCYLNKIRALARKNED